MTPEKESPTTPNGNSIASQGQEYRERVAPPAWARKRRPQVLVHFDGQYVTPAELNAQAAQEAAQVRAGRLRALTALRAKADSQEAADGPGSVEARQITPHPVPAFGSSWTVDGLTGECTPLPCRSLGTTATGRLGKASPRGLSGAHKKTALALSWNVAYLGEKYGANRIGFLTLTFRDHVTCAREASRRFHSLATGVLKDRYVEYIRVLERQKNGRIHYHLLVVCREDIRTGFDFDAVAAQDYRSANSYIRNEWAFLRKSAKKYGFGRTELLPIKSNAEAMAQYVGKYIGKHFNSRIEQDKGVRLVSYSSGARMATSRFTKVGSTYANEWRAKLCTFVMQINSAKLHGVGRKSGNKHGFLRIDSLGDLTEHLGKNWSFHWREFICNLPPSDLSIPF